MKATLTRDIPTLGGIHRTGMSVYARENNRGRFDLFRDPAMTQLLVCDCPRSKEATEAETRWRRRLAALHVRDVQRQGERKQRIDSDMDWLIGKSQLATWYLEMHA